MKTRAAWLSMLVAVVALVALMAPIADAKRGKHQKQKLRKAESPLVIGHRGASGYYPEHTLQSYRLAIRLGADYIEPDLVATKDGVLIARHEPVLGVFNAGGDSTDVENHPEFADKRRKETIDGVEYDGWFAKDFTLAEIKTLRARQTRSPPRSTQFDDKFQIPTFQEVINLARLWSKRSGREIGIYPETKHPTWHQDLMPPLPLEGRLVKALKRNSLNRRNAPVFIQSFEQANLKQLNRMTKVPLIQLVDAWDTNPDGSLVYTPPSDRPYDWTKSGRTDLYSYFATDAGLAEIKTYADGLGPWKPYIVPMTPDGSTLFTPTDLVQRAHQHGLLIHTWTFRDDSFPSAYANPMAEYKKFYELGIDGVFSDFPDTAVIARDFFWNS